MPENKIKINHLTLYHTVLSLLTLKLNKLLLLTLINNNNNKKKIINYV